MDRYIHQRPGWPEFIWINAELAEPLAALRFRQGLLLGRAASPGLDQQLHATRTSLDTALRDLNDLIEKGITECDPAGGRSTSYSRRKLTG